MFYNSSRQLAEIKQNITNRQYSGPVQSIF